MNIWLLSLTHPDFLPPIYSMANVLKEEGHIVKMFSFTSKAPADLSSEIIEHINMGNHTGGTFSRLNARIQYIKKLKEHITLQKPDFIFSFCEFSFYAALKCSKNIPIIFNSLEIVNFKSSSIFSAPFTFHRNRFVFNNLNKAALITTPSQERSGWLAGRYNVTTIPQTVLNTPYPIQNTNQFYSSELIPEHLKKKTKILHTGGVNSTRAVKELLESFINLNDTETALIITNMQEVSYCNQLKNIAAQSNVRENILFLPTISRNDLIKLQNSCNIGINLMNQQHTLGSRMIAPNKVGEYMNAGLIVVGMENPYMYQFLTYKTTVLVSDITVAEITNGLVSAIQLAKNPDTKKRIRNCLTEWYNMKVQMKPILKMLSNN